MPTDNTTLADSGLVSAYGGQLPDAVTRFVACALSMVNYDEKITFDQLAQVIPAGMQELVYGFKFLDQPGNPEYKDIVCADLITVAYAYALGVPPPKDWSGCDPNPDPNPDHKFISHYAANFYRPCRDNVGHLAAQTNPMSLLPANQECLPGDLIVYGNYNSPIACHVLTYVGPVNWLTGGEIRPQGQCVVNASINSFEGHMVQGSGSIWLRHLDNARNAGLYGYDWAEQVRILDLWN